MNIQIYNDEECILAAEELSKHVNGKEAFSLQIPNVGLGISVSGDLGKKIIVNHTIKIVHLIQQNVIVLAFLVLNL